MSRNSAPHPIRLKRPSHRTSRRQNHWTDHSLHPCSARIRPSYRQGARHFRCHPRYSKSNRQTHCLQLRQAQNGRFRRNQSHQRHLNRCQKPQSAHQLSAPSQLNRPLLSPIQNLFRQASRFHRLCSARNRRCCRQAERLCRCRRLHSKCSIPLRIHRPLLSRPNHSRHRRSSPVRFRPIRILRRLQVHRLLTRRCGHHHPVRQVRNHRRGQIRRLGPIRRSQSRVRRR